MKTPLRRVLATVIAAAMLAGCGAFGCAGAGGSGGISGGCAAGVRF